MYCALLSSCALDTTIRFRWQDSNCTVDARQKQKTKTLGSHYSIEEKLYRQEFVKMQTSFTFRVRRILKFSALFDICVFVRVFRFFVCFVVCRGVTFRPRTITD